MSQAWVWVFSRIEGLRWVLEHERMAFPERAKVRLSRMAKSDRAILYVSRMAFGTPLNDEARLVGVARVMGPPEKRTVAIEGTPFAWAVPFQVQTFLAERGGPAVRSLASRLDLVKRREVWGTYFRNSPIEISQHDFNVMTRAIEDWRKKKGSDSPAHRPTGSRLAN